MQWGWGGDWLNRVCSLLHQRPHAHFGELSKQLQRVLSVRTWPPLQRRAYEFAVYVQTVISRRSGITLNVRNEPEFVYLRQFIRNCYSILNTLEDLI